MRDDTVKKLTTIKRGANSRSAIQELASPFLDPEVHYIIHSPLDCIKLLTVYSQIKCAGGHTNTSHNYAFVCKESSVEY
jgi:hypothetical protein